MAKDYAKRVFTTRPTKRKRRRIEYIIIPILLMVGVIGYWFYTHGSSFSAQKKFFAQVKELFTHTKQHKEVAKAKPIETAPQGPDIHFDFYNELPSMKVKPEVVDNSSPKVHDPESPGATKGAYILELGSFKDTASASDLRLSLLLSGCEAEIVTIKSMEGTIYRVQRGPFISQAEAKKLQRKLEKKGIVAMLKKA